MVLEFLKYAYFNMTKGDSMNDILIKCAEKAYLDFCRTIKFNTENKDTRKGANRKICEMLVHEYDVLANAVKESDEKQNAFDCEHKIICEEIINTYSEISELTYEQAQKWLNMMLKYVLMTAEDFALKNYLHIPVDSYIMQAVGSDDTKLKHCLKLECVPKKDGTVGKYSESTSKPWSKWNYEEYIAFQDSIRTAISEREHSSPIEWENAAWIEVAEYRK